MTESESMPTPTRGRAQKGQTGAGGAASWVGVTVFLLFLALLVSFFLGLLPVAPVAVATGSMEPTIQVGDVVIVRRTDPDQLQVGDIVRYRKDNYSVIHRIVAQQERQDGQTVSFTTQGDNNNGPDSDPVMPDQIMGKVILTVPNAGKLTLWLHSLF